MREAGFEGSAGRFRSRRIETQGEDPGACFKKLRRLGMPLLKDLPMTRRRLLNNMSTRPTSLAALDLNLLVVFDAVFAERHISRAARRLGKSQPAISGALARLRSLLGDPLFVRDGAGMRPTRLANELAAPIREALQLLNQSLRRDRDYAPATSNRTFHLNLNDYTQTILLPRLLAQLRSVAPDVRLATTSLPVDEMESALKRGALDLAVDCHTVSAVGLYQQKLFDDEFVCLVRKGHPHVRNSLTPAQFVTLGHGVIKHGPVPGLIERLLTKSKVNRNALVTSGAPETPSPSMRISAGSSIARVSPVGASTSTIRSAMSADTGFTPGAMLSASAKLMGRAALSG